MKAKISPPLLPIDSHLGAIVGDARTVRRFVLVAEPGAGKTTRVPPALLDVVPGEIWVCQPRRLAARMAARRVAAERGQAVGEVVGYAVRFESVASARTRIRFVTEGVFRRRLTSDPTLAGVGAVLLDEFHERSLDADLSLASLRQLIRVRTDLVVGVMSATLDAESVASFLEAPIHRVPGRTYPIEVAYLDGYEAKPLEKRVHVAVHRLRDVDGDILVFLPGAREIRRTAAALEERVAQLDFDLVTLHGDLPPDEQEHAIRRGSRRKIILSTNVAETSLTVEGVAAVVDGGLTRRASYSPWTGRRVIETRPASRASCVQRAGRAGRLGPGRCLRLFDEHDFRSRPAHDLPEIARADFATSSLMLRFAGHDPRHFDYFEEPSAPTLTAADRLLEWLGALDDGRLTTDGETMAVLPAHPRLAATVVEGARRGIAGEACTLAALLEARDIRRAARSLVGGRDDGWVGRSDVLDRFEAFEEARRSRFSDRVIRGLELDPRSVREVDRARRQLEASLPKSVIGARPTFQEEIEEAMLISILRGFGDRVMCRRVEAGPDVVFAGGGAAKIAPSSVVRHERWAVAVDVDDRGGAALVRLASAIEPEWLLDLFEMRIHDVDELRFNPHLECVERVRAVRFGALTLDESTARADGPEAAALLAKEAFRAGFARFVDGESLERLQRRVAFAAQHGRVTPLGDETLRAVLRDASLGATHFNEIRSNSPMDLLKAQLDLRVIDRFAPDRVSLPGVRNGAIVHYEHDRPPWIAARLQDLYGLAEGPRVADGAVPLVMHLLAPNDRAVQVTTDLAGFWREHYPAQRKQLSRRYPKHFFPQDPAASVARRMKPRGS